MIKIIEGDLLESGADVICHQVNCQGKMNSGIAKAIREKYPKAYEKYREVCKGTNSNDLLGNAFEVKVDENTVVFNLFAQNNYGYDGKQYTDLNALKSCFVDLFFKVKGLEYNKGYSLRIALPYKIGCVRGGANWDEVYAIIKDVFQDHDVELWRLDRG